MAFFSVLFFFLKKSQSNGKYFGLIDPFTRIFWSIAQIYLFCNFGENVTNRFSAINDSVYECSWYSFPKEVQRILPIVMVSAQQSLVIKAFGNILCTRQTFKTVNKSNTAIQFFVIKINVSIDFFHEFGRRLGHQWWILVFHRSSPSLIRWFNLSMIFSISSSTKILVLSGFFKYFIAFVSITQ